MLHITFLFSFLCFFLWTLYVSSPWGVSDVEQGWTISFRRAYPNVSLDSFLALSCNETLHIMAYTRTYMIDQGVLDLYVGERKPYLYPSFVDHSHIVSYWCI